MKRLLATLVLTALVAPAWAATRVATLSIPKMNCPACPITIKEALSKVAGVSEIKVSLEKKQAVVTYDDAKTSIAPLTQATANAGFPSTVKP
jgi:mercuric ion binding protein